VKVKLKILEEIREYEQKMYERALKACDDAEEKERLHVRQLVAGAIQSQSNKRLSARISN